MLKQNKLLILLLAGFAGLVSCKKNDTFNDLKVNTDRSIVEFTDAAAGTSLALDASDDLVTVDLTEIRLFIRSAPKGATVKATVISTPAIIAAYNADNGTNYTALPNAAFTLDPAEYNFTDTDREKMVRVKLRPSDLLNDEYAIGLSISTVVNGEVSQKAKAVVVAISVKNKYDGRYYVVGSVVDANGIYTGVYPYPDVAFRTAGVNSVDYLDPNYSVGAPFFDNAFIIENIASGAPTWLYSPRFVFDTNTDKATAILDNDGGAPFGTISAGGPNQFTIASPDDKVFKIKYTALSGRLTITETYTYIGPR